MPIVEMYVHMDCAGCEDKIRKTLQKLEGVDEIDIDMGMQKVTIMGWATQKKVLKAVKKTGRRAELWPFPYNPEINNYDPRNYYSNNNHYEHNDNYYFHQPNYTHHSYELPQIPPHTPIITSKATLIMMTMAISITHLLLLWLIIKLALCLVMRTPMLAPLCR